MGSRKLEGKRLTDDGLQELKLDQLFRTHINVVRGTFAGRRIERHAETSTVLGVPEEGHTRRVRASDNSKRRLHSQRGRVQIKTSFVF
jgi:hypothetical protein